METAYQKWEKRRQERTGGHRPALSHRRKRAAWRWVRVRSAGWRSWQYVWRCFWWYLSEKEYFQESSRRYGRLF